MACPIKVIATKNTVDPFVVLDQGAMVINRKSDQILNDSNPKFCQSLD